MVPRYEYSIYKSVIDWLVKVYCFMWSKKMMLCVLNFVLDLLN